jgi:hypothetical protein
MAVDLADEFPLFARASLVLDRRPVGFDGEESTLVEDGSQGFRVERG